MEDTVRRMADFRNTDQNRGPASLVKNPILMELNALIIKLPERLITLDIIIAARYH
jgi:hypothetical protein